MTNRLHSFDVTKERKVEARELPQEQLFYGLNHGTICAHIINTIMPNVYTFDIKIMNKNKGEVENLIIALDWCCNKNVSIINISLGTTNYHDYIKMKDVISKLIQKGTIIVAAMDNAGLKSFPAYCEKVFGVRASTNMGKYGYYFTMEKSEPIEKKIIISYNEYIKNNRGDNIRIGCANSFAAPVLTGKIAQMMSENQSLSFEKICDYFLKEFIPIKNTDDILKKKYQNHTCDIKIPIINIDSSALEKLSSLYEWIEKQGYYAEVISDYKSTIEVLPATFYCGSKKLSNNILKMVEHIYKPDLIVTCLNETHSPYFREYWEIIDIVIGQMEGHYFIQTKTNIKAFDTFKKLCDSLVIHFDLN